MMKGTRAVIELNEAKANCASLLEDISKEVDSIKEVGNPENDWVSACKVMQINSALLDLLNPEDSEDAVE